MKEKRGLKKPPLQPKEIEEDLPYKFIETDIHEKKKCASMESEDDLLADVAWQWFNMMSASRKKKVTSPLKFKKELQEEKKDGSSSEEVLEKKNILYVPCPDEVKEEQKEVKKEQKKESSARHSRRN